MEDAGLGEVGRLRAELDQLSQRVSRLEAQLGRAAMPPPAAPRSGTRFGLTAINRIGAVTVAIGVIFFFKYAVDEHLIGAAAGCILGALFGGALIGAGDWLMRHGQSVFAQGISGCGLAALYISLYASFAFYDLIPTTAGFFALVVVCGAAVALSMRFRSAAMATLGIAGALLTPWLLHTAASQHWLEWIYLLLVTVTAVAIAVGRDWPSLAIVSGVLSLFAALALFAQAPWWFVALGAVLGAWQLLAASRVPVGRSVRNSLHVLAHAAFLAAAWRGLGLLVGNRNLAYQAGSVLLAGWAIAALTWGLARKSKLNVRLGLVLLALVIAKLYMWDVWSLEKIYRITAFFGLGGLLLLASWIYSRTSVSDRL